jgi:hypothetical protein
VRILIVATSPPCETRCSSRFARCMREHRVNMPDPEAGPRRYELHHPAGTNRTSLDKAQAVCQHFLQGAMAPPKAADRQKLIDAALKWASCMRQNGVSVPDPTPGNGGAIKIGPGLNQNPDDPAFQRADTRCRHFLPGRGPVPPGHRRRAGAAAAFLGRRRFRAGRRHA